MTKWGINFVVDGKHLGDVMEVLQPYRVEDLGFKIVAGTPNKVRAGDKAAWEIAAGLADATPQTYWLLSVTKQMAAVDYNDRLRVSRELARRVANNDNGLRHNSLKDAARAAAQISTSPLVLKVVVTRVQVIAEGVWWNGEKDGHK